MEPTTRADRARDEGGHDHRERHAELQPLRLAPPLGSQLERVSRDSLERE
jgi:hypothetical protein